MIKNLNISEVLLENVNCFDNLRFKLNEGYNLICGTNGIGKTTILNAIGCCFVSFWTIPSVRRRAGSLVDGMVRVSLREDHQEKSAQIKVGGSEPGSSVSVEGTAGHLSPWLLYMGTNRDFPYTQLQNIGRDAPRTGIEPQQHALSGIGPFETKNWFVNRYLFSPYSDTWPLEHRKNFELSKKCFSILDEHVSLKEVKTSTFDIIVSTPGGDIPYEFLSSGFRSALSLLLSLIREIEFRNLGVSASEFAGIIMIDEIDLHLHPTWQQTMPRALKDAFPKAQIIVTTHSPHMIQDALSDEVIALSADSEGKTRLNPMSHTKYGFRGWTVEEILEDVMGVADVHSKLYRILIRNFDDAVDEENADKVLSCKKELDLMLHPNNPLRKLIRIQAAPFAGGNL